MTNKKIVSLGMVALVVAFTATSVALADTDVRVGLKTGILNHGNEQKGDDKNNNGQKNEEHKEFKGFNIPGDKNERNAIMGQVSAVNGNTITLTSKNFDRDRNGTTTTVFTVDASNALVFRNSATSTVSSITVGESLLVKGTLTGSNIVATRIYDIGVKPVSTKKDDDKNDKTPFVGNGQPIIAGKVTAVTSTSITITNESNLTYVVNIANSKFVTKGKGVASVSNVVVGDTVVVQGTINGNAVTATTVFDQSVSSSNNTGNGNPGFFGKMRGWFGRLFGF